RIAVELGRQGRHDRAGASEFLCTSGWQGRFERNGRSCVLFLNPELDPRHRRITRGTIRDLFKWFAKKENGSLDQRFFGALWVPADVCREFFAAEGFAEPPGWFRDIKGHGM